MSEELMRKFPCAVCEEPLIATKIINGWLLSCGCGTIHRANANFSESEFFVPLSISE